MAGVLFGIAQVCAITGSVAVYAELSNVNRKLPDDQQISYFWWYFSKYRRVDGLYRQYYPAGRLILLRRICFGIGAASMIAFAKILGFFN